MRAAPRLAGVLAALLATLAAGCQGTRLQWATARAVRAYNDALVTAYRTGDLGPLEAAAGPAELRRVATLVDVKRAAGLVLEASLAALTLRDVTATATGVTVRTRERWSYHDRPTAPGGVAGPHFVAEMEMVYHLVRHDGRWRVASGRTLACRYLEPRGFTLGASPGEARAVSPGHGR